MTSLDKLSQIIPPDQALANKALAVSLQGITGINNLTLPMLASAVANVQTNYGLPLINAEASAVSPGAANVILHTVGTGTGPSGTVTLMDGLGTAAGWVQTDALVNTLAILSHLDTSYLRLGYENMLNTVNGNYVVQVDAPIPDPPPDPPVPPTILGYEVIIPAGPGAGTYGLYSTANLAINAAFVSLIPAVQSVINSFSSSHPTEYAALNSNWSKMVSQLLLEKSIQAKANLNFANLIPNSTESIYGFVFALPGYGQDTSVGGTAQYIQRVADLTSIGGQAVVGAMRQGQSNINGTGIGTSSNVPVAPNPPPPDATLLPAQYPYPQPVIT